MARVIVVAGEALIDLLVQPDDSVVATPGGGPFNTSRTIARLGVPVAFLGRLSTDRFGRRLASELARDGVDLRVVTSTDAPTTLAIAELDAEGAASYRFHLAGTSAAGLSVDEVRAGMAALRPVAVHVGTLGLAIEPMASTLAALVAALPASVLLMVDPNCRPAAITEPSAYVSRLRRILARAAIVKASVEDLAYLSPGASAVDAARHLVAAGAGVVLVTDGPRPVRVVGTGIDLEVPVPRVSVVDTVGCGDAFGGAFLAHWIEFGLGRAGTRDEGALRDAATAAVEVSAATAGRAGADPPRRSEVGWSVA
jgi:fructokinase